jgi:hypothetical protein
MCANKQTVNFGFISLISVILVSSILLALAVFSARAGFWSRFNALDFKNRTEASFLSESCANIVLADLIKNPDYQIDGGEKAIIFDSDKICKICEISATTPRRIIIRAIVKNKYNNSFALSNLEIVAAISPDSFIINKWVEFSSYSGPCSLP